MELRAAQWRTAGVVASADESNDFFWIMVDLCRCWQPVSSSYDLQLLYLVDGTYIGCRKVNGDLYFVTNRHGKSWQVVRQLYLDKWIYLTVETDRAPSGSKTSSLLEKS